MNGLFYGNGTGCSKTCTREPICRDTAGHNRACDAVCGDGNLDPGEGCDDGNLVDGDGCSSQCKQEAGFTCTTQILQDSSTCQSGTGQCLELPVIYRDFLPENAAGGHPDFYWLGTQSNGQVSRWCVPDSGGPAKANGNTARCWDMVASELLNGKPQFNLARPDGNLCPCEFSDWNVGNSIYTDSNFQLTLNGYTAKRSICVARCGDGIVSAAEECDLGTQNSDTAYGGCTTQCQFGPFCGDGMKNGPEECDLGKNNGNAALGADGCTLGCTKPL